jgi:hypothetical protein
MGTRSLGTTKAFCITQIYQNKSIVIQVTMIMRNNKGIKKIQQAIKRETKRKRTLWNNETDKSHYSTPFYLIKK